jgi:hypothetical protein
MCVGVWTPWYGGQQDCPIDRFMGVCSRSFFHRIQEYQTKKIRGDYLGSRHLEDKHPMPCGWCILMGLHTRDPILHLFHLSMVSVCMCCVTPFFRSGCLPFIIQGDTTMTGWKKAKHYWIGQTVCRCDDRLARETHANNCSRTHHQSYHLLMLLAEIVHHASGVGNDYMSHQSNDWAMQDANPPCNPSTHINLTVDTSYRIGIGSNAYLWVGNLVPEVAQVI